MPPFSRTIALTVVLVLTGLSAVAGRAEKDRARNRRVHFVIEER